MGVRGLEVLSRRVNACVEIVVGLITGVMVAVTFLQVICRYVFDSSLSWSEEFARYAFIWAIFLGLGSAARHGQHMAVTALAGVLGEGARAALRVFIALVCIVFFALFGYAAWLLTDNAIGQVSTALEIPIAVVYVSAPIGAILIILQLVNELVQGASSAGRKAEESSGDTGAVNG